MRSPLSIVGGSALAGAAQYLALPVKLNWEAHFYAPAAFGLAIGAIASNWLLAGRGRRRARLVLPALAALAGAALAVAYLALIDRGLPAAGYRLSAAYLRDVGLYCAIAAAWGFVGEAAVRTALFSSKAA